MTELTVTTVAGVIVTGAAICADDLLGVSSRAGERAAKRRGPSGALESGLDRTIDALFAVGLTMLAAGTPRALLSMRKTQGQDYRKVVKAWNASWLS